MKKLFIPISALLFSNIAFADYHVEAKFYENNQLISSPNLVVKPQTEALVNVENDYKFSVLAKEVNSNSVHLNLNHTRNNSRLSLDASVLLNTETTFNVNGTLVSVLVSKVES